MAPGPCLLVAVPDAGARQSLLERFQRSGYAVAVADTLAITLHQVVSHAPDAVIISAQLPGLGILNAVKCVRAITTAPILVLPSSGDQAPTSEILDAGADDCIGVPIMLEELAARVRRLLRRTASVATPDIGKPDVICTGRDGGSRSNAWRGPILRPACAEDLRPLNEADKHRPRLMPESLD